MNHLHYRRALNGLGQAPNYTPGQLVETEVLATGSGTMSVVAMDFSYIPPGSFIMGSDGPSPVEPANAFSKNKVTLTRGFLMGRTEVTQQQWFAVMGTDPSHFKGANLPVETVSWFDAVEYCNALSRLSGFPEAYVIKGKDVKLLKNTGYRLPTEAEWEYACRAGSGSILYGPVEDIAWAYPYSSGKTHPVGGKKPNAFGLYDMLGNVAEWVWDWYGPYGLDSRTDPQGPDGGVYKILRGGSWTDDFSFMKRINYRNTSFLGFQDSAVGFRICRSVE